MKYIIQDQNFNFLTIRGDFVKNPCGWDVKKFDSKEEAEKELKDGFKLIKARS